MAVECQMVAVPIVYQDPAYLVPALVEEKTIKYMGMVIVAHLRTKAQLTMTHSSR